MGKRESCQSIRQMQDAKKGVFFSAADVPEVGGTATVKAESELPLPAPTRKLAHLVESWTEVGQSLKSQLPAATFTDLLVALSAGTTLRLTDPTGFDSAASLEAQGIDPKYRGITNADELRELRRKK